MREYKDILISHELTRMNTNERLITNLILFYTDFNWIGMDKGGDVIARREATKQSKERDCFTPFAMTTLDAQLTN